MIFQVTAQSPNRFYTGKVANDRNDRVFPLHLLHEAEILLPRKIAPILPGRVGGRHQFPISGTWRSRVHR
ncbi:MAG: hypothetical protein DMG11_17960 [Acidobacteria bacterium]|nr:MAG: hypothetical protein DMG11_17960 [Acidobacteriota bacterium]